LTPRVAGPVLGIAAAELLTVCGALNIADHTFGGVILLTLAFLPL
jgi:hypothetical protein